MNPAALKANIADLKGDGILIVNIDAFTARNLEKAGYDSKPLEDNTLSSFRVHEVPITNLTLEAIADCGLNQRAAVRSVFCSRVGIGCLIGHRTHADLDR